MLIAVRFHQTNCALWQTYLTVRLSIYLVGQIRESEMMKMNLTNILLTIGISAVTAFFVSNIVAGLHFKTIDKYAADMVEFAKKEIYEDRKVLKTYFDKTFSERS